MVTQGRAAGFGAYSRGGESAQCSDTGNRDRGER